MVQIYPSQTCDFFRVIATADTGFVALETPTLR